jgi:hypothetical protein
LTFLLTGFFTASTLSVTMSGRSISEPTEGLGEGKRAWKGMSGTTLVSLTTGLSIWTDSESTKPFRERKDCQLSS